LVILYTLFIVHDVLLGERTVNVCHLKFGVQLQAAVPTFFIPNEPHRPNVRLYCKDYYRVDQKVTRHWN